MVAKVLFPVDFSPACLAMAPYVKRAADLFGARVTMVYVCDLASHNGFELCVRASKEIADDHATLAQERLEAFLNNEFPGCERILRSGDAAEEIAGVARSGAFDPIVMPTQAGRFRRMLLGSTTAKVLNDAECPVMTTEHAESVPRPFVAPERAHGLERHHVALRRAVSEKLGSACLSGRTRTVLILLRYDCNEHE